MVIRLKGENCPVPSSVLKKHLLQIFLSALYYDGELAIHFMESHQITASVLMELFQMKKQFRTKFESKSFITGMCQVMTTVNVPESVKDHNTVARIIKECLEMLQKI